MIYATVGLSSFSQRLPRARVLQRYARVVQRQKNKAHKLQVCQKNVKEKISPPALEASSFFFAGKDGGPLSPWERVWGWQLRLRGYQMVSEELIEKAATTIAAQKTFGKQAL